ncbi:O-antigen ligase family protein [Nevskia sp.]|uniref:O-antigen ligase family protein n=1 Tax=Nevskia sp. TaxID=1929292 RepID=UPI003F6FCBA9
MAAGSNDVGYETSALNGIAVNAANNFASGSPSSSGLRTVGFLLVAGYCFLTPLTDIRLADVQSIEAYGLICLLAAYGFFARNDWSFTAPRQLAQLFRLHVLLITAVISLAALSLRLDTFPPFALPPLKTPPLLSLSRIVQLAVCIGGFLLLTLAMVRRPSLIRLAAQLYVWSGLLSASYALLSYAAWHAGVELPGAYNVSFIRARGFFVEGGPLGVYLMSVIVTVAFRMGQLGQQKKIGLVQMAILFTALLAAQSKAALLLGMFMVVIWQLLDRRYLRLLVGVAVVMPIFVVAVANRGLGDYVRIVMNFEEEIQTHADDSSYAMGRIMATVLAPRMIMEHPLAGVGIGNYSLQRNNPEILNGLPTTDGWDLPGLSYIGYAAELGLPCTLFLMWLIWRPVNLAADRLVKPVCLVLCAYQFVAHLFGAQVTFAYPWVTTSIGLAYALTQLPGKRLTGGRPFRLVWNRSAGMTTTSTSDS